MRTYTKAMLGAAVSGILLAGASGVASPGGEPVELVLGKCLGVNDCRGKGECAGVKQDGTAYSCAGQNECKGRGFLKLDKNDCETRGGRFSP